MRVQEIMTTDVEACRPTNDLASIAMSMWRRDCGIVPVIDDSGRAIGVVTDRDICIAVATRHRRPEELTAREVMTGKLFSVRPEDDVRAVLELMGRERVRRIPVVNGEGRLRGILSINDLVLHAQPSGTRPTPVVSANDVLETLRKICEHPLPAKRPPVEKVLEHAHA
jgi:CBS-domain-containing membrane protein